MCVSVYVWWGHLLDFLEYWMFLYGSFITGFATASSTIFLSLCNIAPSLVATDNFESKCCRLMKRLCNQLSIICIQQLVTAWWSIVNFEPIEHHYSWHNQTWIYTNTLLCCVPVTVYLLRMSTCDWCVHILLLLGFFLALLKPVFRI
jgi:hypothetical protein